jgi:hypothetical protein
MACVVRPSRRSVRSFMWGRSANVGRVLRNRIRSAFPGYAPSPVGSCCLPHG